VPADLLRVLVTGYALSVVLETPVLLAALAPPHSWRRRVFAGVWLTACTYPLLGLVLPTLIDPWAARTAYLAVGETLVPVVEVALFWLAFDRGRGYPRRWLARDAGAIVAANLVSFLLPELWRAVSR
jgi:hypothetical protein